MTNTSMATEGIGTRSLLVSKTNEKIVVDGNLDEHAWSVSTFSGDFIENFPSDTSLASSQTEVSMIYDDENLFVAIKCYDLKPGPYNVTSLRRDFKGPENDQVVVVLDPFLDKTNGFVFGVNAYGSMKEGLVSGGGEQDTDYSWDNKWYAETSFQEGYWVVEMAIPFKTLRYKKGSENWNVNIYRLDTKQSERSSWSAIPKSFRLTSLAFTGNLTWEEPLGKPGTNLAVIPFVSTGISRDNLNGTGTAKTFEVGGDIKIGVTPSLNLDLTVNPDFSQVEVDDQVTDLSRFEIFFEEKRQFFLENADLFANFGTETIRPFFSRRIGIAYDSAIRQYVPNPILFGARLSGKINNNWRVGLMSIQGAKDSELNLPSQNYSVAVLQRKVFSRSNITALFVNKQPVQLENHDSSAVQKSFNRVLGLEYNLASVNGRWNGKLFYLQSFDSNRDQQRQSSHGSVLQYKTPYITVDWSHEYVSDSFNAEVGFIPRKAYYKINPGIQTYTYPQSSVINRHGPGISFEAFWDTSGNSIENTLTVNYEIFFQNLAQLKVEAKGYDLELLNDFDPTKSGGEKLKAGNEYRYYDVKIDFTSDKRKKFYYNLVTQNGQYFDGTRYSFSGSINYRIPPKAIFSVAYSYNKINMPDPYEDGDIWLLGPKIDLTFLRNLYYTTLVQYNNQIDNININSRLQWRFKSVSDLFIVYSDNYFSESLKSKNRAIVIKLSYWFNV